MATKNGYKVEKARIGDIPQIHKLINSFALKGLMLARPLGQLYENIRDFFVVRKGKKIVGCAALHVIWSDLAEIKSVAVDEELQKQGIGQELIQHCLDEANTIGLKTVFCLTYRPDFFGKQGLTEIEKEKLPTKIWTECYHCPKYPDCDETAMRIQLRK